MPDPHNAHTVVIAHSDRKAREALAAQLDLDGHTVHGANRTTNTVGALTRTHADLLLLGELEQPAAGPRLLRALRDAALTGIDSALPVITLGAADQVNQLRAYDDGSDHHVAANIPYATLRAVIAAVMRRSAGPRKPNRLQIGALAIDVTARRVTVHDQLVALTPMEFDLLRTLAAEPQRVFTKAELLETVWGYPDPRSTRTLDSHACRLRRHLAEHGQQMILNRWGVGYALVA